MNTSSRFRHEIARFKFHLGIACAFVTISISIPFAGACTRSLGAAHWKAESAQPVQLEEITL
jgi:hypothetical protein